MNNEEILSHLLSFLQVLRKYHKHEVVGIENVPARGRALLAFNHSFATYDISLLFAAIAEERKRLARPLADRLFFRIPHLSALVEAIGGVEGSPDGAERLLREGHLVAVAPGGMHEAIRPLQERYKLCWENRRGFIKLAILTQAPIVLAMCPRADDIYDVYPNPITRWAYDNLRIPLVLARGFGPTILPRPTKLVHYVGTPITPPKAAATEKGLKTQISRLHAKVLAQAEELMAMGLQGDQAS